MSAEDAEDDGMERTWLVPHPTAWIEDAYDGESQRRSEHLARVAAGDDHPIRCVRAAFATRETQPLLPPPLTLPVAAAESGAGAAVVPPARAFCVSAAGAAPPAPGTDGPLGAAATYCADNDASSDGRFVELSSRLDRGSCNFSSASVAAHSTAAELYGVVLAARVAAAHREIVSEVFVTVNQPHIPEAMQRLRTEPIDRRRIASGASDASNILQVYGSSSSHFACPVSMFRMTGPHRAWGDRQYSALSELPTPSVLLAGTSLSGLTGASLNTRGSVSLVVSRTTSSAEPPRSSRWPSRTLRHRDVSSATPPTRSPCPGPKLFCGCAKAPWVRQGLPHDRSPALT